MKRVYRAVFALACLALSRQQAGADDGASIRPGQATTGYDPLAAGSRDRGYDPLAPRRDDGARRTGPQYDPTDEFSGLPRTLGHETVYYQCTYCHSAQIIMQQRLPRSRWNYVLDWMVAKQGMPEPSPEVRAEILDYLVRHFSPESGRAAQQGDAAD
jgi:hypothetical protein